MIEVRLLEQLNAADLRRVAAGYTSEQVYTVTYADADEQAAIALKLAPLANPITKCFDHFDTETVERYRQALNGRFSFGAYDGELLVGLLLAEAQQWNQSLWVWEFHVVEAYRRQGIGRRLMDRAVAAARQAGLRIIVCETQNTNAPAIHAYRRLGFRVEGIDISYYTNEDYPGGEIAVFMKRRV